MLTFNQESRPFNIFGWSCLMNCFYDPANTQANQVVEDHQVHGGMNGRAWFRHFEVHTGGREGIN